jgi:single-stranded DNA-binding protein
VTRPGTAGRWRSAFWPLAVTRRARSDIGDDAKWTLVPAAAAYIDVASFGKPAEAGAKVLTQGWLVAVSGRLEYAEWETADGAKRSGHQVIGHVEFLAAPKGAGDAVDDAAQAQSRPTDDGIAF